MKKLYLWLVGLCMTIGLQAQVEKTVELTSGNLAVLLTDEEKNTITSLTLIGTVDARDFITTSLMPLLTELDLSQTQVTAIHTSFNDRVAISKADTIGSYGYNPRESSSLFSSRLTSLKLPSTLKAIDINGLKNCSGLTALEIPSTVTFIGLYAFWGCSGLTSLSIPSSVTYIETEAFYGCSGLEELILSASIDGIKRYTFAFCSSLTTLTIPSQIVYIEEGGFMDCTALTTVILPETFQGLDHFAFLRCPNITSIYSYNPNPPALASGAFDTEIFDGTVYVPSGSGALYGEAEGWKDFENIVEESPGFSLSDTILYFDIIEQSKSIEVNSSKAWTAVSDQSWLTVSPASGNSSGTITVTAEANATSTYRFANITVTPAEGEPQMIRVTQKSYPVVIPLSAGDLGNILTREELDTITSLTLTGTINANDIHIISSMPLLTALDISQTIIVETTYEYGNIPGNWIGGLSVGKNSMNICGGLSNGLLKTIKLPPTLTVLACGAFYGCGFSSFVIPPSVSKIGWEAFNACTNLESIVIPATVTYIDQWAFSSCTGLKEVIIEEGINYIPRGTFAGCSSLTSVILPASMKGIELDAFWQSPNIATIYSYNPIPPYASNGFNSADKSSCIVYVPVGSAAAYAEAEGWKDFTHIVELVPFTLSATEFNVEAVPAVQSLEITTDGEWYITCDTNWLTVSPASGESTKTVTFTCLENTTFEPRTATVTFNDKKDYSQTVTITQKARINNLPVADAGDDQTVEEGALVQLDGSASEDADMDILIFLWTSPEGITLSSVSDARPTFTAPKIEKDTTYTFKLVVNDGMENSASDKVVITITNKTIELEVSADSVVFESKQSSAKIIVSGNAQWSATSDKDWLTVSPATGEGQGEITLSAMANETTAERVATVTISVPETEAKTITVTQHGLVTAVDHLASQLTLNGYPNPFTNHLSVDIANPSLGEVTVEIYSISGQKIKTLARSQKGAKISLQWNGEDEQGQQVSDGMYLLKVNGMTRQVVKR